MDESVKYEFFKKNESDVIWLVTTDPPMKTGSLLFSFDKKRVYSFFGDYPNSLSKGELAIFNAEFPEWARFYKTGEM